MYKNRSVTLYSWLTCFQWRRGTSGGGGAIGARATSRVYFYAREAVPTRTTCCTCQDRAASWDRWCWRYRNTAATGSATRLCLAAAWGRFLTWSDSSRFSTAELRLFGIFFNCWVINLADWTTINSNWRLNRSNTNLTASMQSTNN